jgi:hypothetical protein
MQDRQIRSGVAPVISRQILWTDDTYKLSLAPDETLRAVPR